MSVNQELNLRLYAELRRSGLAPDGSLAGLRLSEGGIGALLDLDPEEVDRRAMEIASQAGILPLGVLSPQQRQHYAVGRQDGLDELVRSTADGLRLHPEVGAPLQVDAAQLVDVLLRKLAYEDYVLVGQRMKDGGMDLRLLNGAWMWFLLDSVMTWLEGRFADPALTAAERTTLLDAFAPALVVVDEMQSASPDQRQAIQAARTNLQGQVAQAQAQAADAATAMAVRHGLPVSRQALLDAARRHLRPAGAGGADVAVAPASGGGPGTRVLD